MSLLFPLLFFQSKLIALNAIGLFGLLISVVYNWAYGNRKIKYIFLFIWFLPLLYVIVNMLIRGVGVQLSSLHFYKNEGDFFVSWLVFLLFFLYSSSSYLSNKRIVWGFLLCLILVIVFSVPYNIINHHHFFLGFFSSHNAAAGLLASVLIVLASAIPFVRNKKLTMLCVFFLLLLFVWAGSRAFSLALFFAIAFMLFRLNLVKFNLKSAVIFVIALMVVSFVLVMQLDRISQAFSGSDYNTETRFFYWEMAYDLFLEYPFLGVGFGMYNDYLVSYFNESDYVLDANGLFYGGRHAHNIILQVLSELGLVGLVVFSLSLFMLMRRRSNSSFINVTGESLFVLLLVASMFGLNFFTPSTSLVFYFFIALRWRPNGKSKFRIFRV